MIRPLLALCLCSGVVHADSLFASDHDGTLVISKLSGDTVSTVYEEPQSGVLEYGWSDAHTLWVLRGKRGFSIGKIVDGVAQKPRPLSRDDWEPKTPTGPAKRSPHLLFAKSGVWLERCVDLEKGQSCDHVYLRVDAKAPIATSVPGEQFVAVEWSVAPKAIAAPPKGFTFAGGTGFSCKGGGKKLAFKAGTRMVTNIEWLSAEPAIVSFGVYRVDDAESDVYDDVDPYVVHHVDDGTGTFYLEDCTTYLDHVIAIEPDVLATTEGEMSWKLRRGKKELATFKATRVIAAPR